MDIIPVGAGRELVIVGDVAGHGLTGALITGILKSVIYPEFVRENRGNCAPAALLDWLNRRMKEAFMSQPGLFITMAVILVDGPAKKVTWSSAGHNPPLLCRSGNFIEMGNPGVALCLEGTMAHNEKSLALEDDDSIWIFTDGLIETGGTDVRQGTLRLETAITATQDMPRSERHATILRKVLEEAGAPRFSDDVTLVSLDHC
jgi:sigma-B regulation protein RsbU (phosphoserine phosphatase)